MFSHVFGLARQAFKKNCEREERTCQKLGSILFHGFFCAFTNWKGPSAPKNSQQNEEEHGNNLSPEPCRRPANPPSKRSPKKPSEHALPACPPPPPPPPSAPSRTGDQNGRSIALVVFFSTYRGLPWGFSGRRSPCPRPGVRSAPAPSPQLAQVETLNMNLLGSGLGPGAWKSKINGGLDERTNSSKLVLDCTLLICG